MPFLHSQLNSRNSRSIGMFANIPLLNIEALQKGVMIDDIKNQ